MELLPCPFCGGDADCIRQGSRYGGFYYVECTVCGAKTRNISAKYETGFDNQYSDKAERCWNLRSKGD